MVLSQKVNVQEKCHRLDEEALTKGQSGLGPFATQLQSLNDNSNLVK